MPALVSFTEAQARAVVEPNGWKIDVRHDRQDGSTAGHILRTVPAEKASLKKGRTLVLFVSDGNKLATVPTDLANKPLAAAQAELTAAGGFVAKQTTAYDETVPAGTVLSVAPGVAAQLPKGSEVPLVVSNGPAARTVPAGLAGKTYDQAAAAITAAGLVPRNVPTFSDTVTSGTVIGTSPGAGPDVATRGRGRRAGVQGSAADRGAGRDGHDRRPGRGRARPGGVSPPGPSGKAGHKVSSTNPPVGSMQPKGTTVDLQLK